MVAEVRLAALIASTYFLRGPSRYHCGGLERDGAADDHVEGAFSVMSASNDQSQRVHPAVLPAASRSLLSDIVSFVLKKPAIPTLVEYESVEEREDNCQRILQRLGVSVTKYAVLNEHRIGVNAPVSFVFEELLGWDAGSLCWPNRIATPERESGSLERIRFFLLDKRDSLFGLKSGFLGLDFIPLFQIDKHKFQEEPDPSLDNARYLLYDCSGGYPIGIFYIYTRSSIATRGEKDLAQVFFGVGFNFYGREDWPKRHFINRLWESVHNRVTANILNRFKCLCEAKFLEVTGGHAIDSPDLRQSHPRRSRTSAP